MMSQTQYNSLMSSLLKQKHALTSLRAKLEGKRERECWSCKGFGHLAQNCRNEGKEKRGATPKNKFEVLSSRVMQCDVKEGRTIRRVGIVKVECFKCGEKGHKCRECPLWVKKEKAVHVVRPQKAQQRERPAYPVKGKAQEKERRLRRAEKKAACPTKGKVQQEE